MAFPDLGTGVTCVFGTSAWQSHIGLESLRVKFGSRPAVKTTVLGSTQPTTGQFGGHTYKPGKLSEPPTITGEFQWDPASGSKPPINAAAETITLTFPDGSTLVGSGFLTDPGEVSVGIDNLMKATFTIQGTGIWN